MKNTLSERKERLRNRIEELCRVIDSDLRYAFETYFDDNPYTYFSMEVKLTQMKTLFETIQNQGHEATTLADLSRAVARMGYVEEGLDEAQSQLYPRRKRKRRRTRFADFFARYLAQPEENIFPSLKEAYAILGLQEGTPLFEATATFRRLAKQYHPDARGGDRSQEADLRRIVEAYQCIKVHFATRV